MNRTVAVNNFGATYGSSYWWYSSHSKESKLSRLNYMDYLLDQHKKLKIEDSYKQKLQTSLNKNKS